jgi:type IV pilus assembly protein PilA
MKTNFKNLVSRIKRRDGFSLVELMIVVAIIGILAALAIPRFQQFQSKSRQSEARSNLAHIYTLQVSYNGDNDTFSNFDCLSLGGANNVLSGSLSSCANASASVWQASSACNTTNDIGFRVTDCKKVRYVYSNKGNQNQFTATAVEIDAGANTSRRVFPGCSTAKADTWQINEVKSLYNNEVASGQTALQACND